MTVPDPEASNLEPQGVFGDLGRALAHVKSPVQFFGLCVGLALGALGSLAVTLTGFDQHIVVGVLAFAVMAPVCVVAYLAAFRPSYLKDLVFMRSNETEDMRIFLDLYSFRSRISGEWWEIIQGVGEPAISYFTISSGSGMQVASINGSAYYSSGKYFSSLQSEAACAKVEERWIFYKWRAEIPVENSTQQAVGWGELTFSKDYKSGWGTYSEIRSARTAEPMQNKVTLYLRATKSEAKLMERSNRNEVGALVMKKAVAHRDTALRPG